jgi:hypothetical protein
LLHHRTGFTDATICDFAGYRELSSSQGIARKRHARPDMSGDGTVVAPGLAGRSKKMTRPFRYRGSSYSHASTAFAHDGAAARLSSGAPLAVALFHLVIRAVAVAAAVIVSAFVPSRAAMADAGSDIVVLRSVEPHIAYRGIPTADKPIAASVEPFPNARFQQSSEALVTGLTDSDLASAVSRSGPAPGAAASTATGRLGAALGPGQSQRDGLGGTAVTGAGSGPVGGIGGQVMQATGAMTGSLMRALAPLGAGARP